MDTGDPQPGENQSLGVIGQGVRRGKMEDRGPEKIKIIQTIQENIYKFYVKIR